MAKIKIDDLPRDQKISIKEMKKVIGGFDLQINAINPQPEPPGDRVFYNQNLLRQLIRFNHKVIDPIDK